VPAGLYLFFYVSAWKGIFLLAWGAILVAMLDHVVRTVLIGRHIKLPILLLFFGLLGGISVYGFRGLLIGPLVVSLLPVFLDIFESQYLRRDKEPNHS